MFRRDIFVLLAAALLGIAFVIYIAIGQTPFFPKSLHTALTDCPERQWEDASLREHPIPADRRPVLDEFETQYFTDVLLGLGEQPLHRATGVNRTTRLTIIGSISGSLAIRTIETDDGRRLVGKRMPFGDGRCNTLRDCAVDRLLTPGEQASLEAAEARLMRRAPFGCSNLPDGSAWLVEASGAGTYRAWHSGSPQDPDVRRLGKIMMNLTGWWPEEPLPPA